MRYATLPMTDTQVSVITLGTTAFGKPLETQDAFRMLDAYVEAGGTFVDTAHAYGGPEHLSEKMIGEWLRQRGGAKGVVIATKGGNPSADAPGVPRLSTESITQELDESLALLGVERIDLYYLHRDDPARPVAEIMEMLAAQQRAGKIRHVACSNWQPARIAEAQAYAASHGLPRFVASQIFWTLATPNAGVLPPDLAAMTPEAQTFSESADLAVVGFTSQARGFFTKAAADGLDALKPKVRADFESEVNLQRLRRLQELASGLGVSVTALTLAYITSHRFTGIPIVGPRSLEQLADCMAGGGCAAEERAGGVSEGRIGAGEVGCAGLSFDKPHPLIKSARCSVPDVDFQRDAGVAALLQPPHCFGQQRAADAAPLRVGFDHQVLHEARRPAEAEADHVAA